MASLGSWYRLNHNTLDREIKPLTMFGLDAYEFNLKSYVLLYHWKLYNSLSGDVTYWFDDCLTTLWLPNNLKHTHDSDSEYKNKLQQKNKY